MWLTPGKKKLIPSEPIKVLFLTLYPEIIPSSRHRVYQHLPYLRQQGIEPKVMAACPEPFFSRLYFSRSKWKHLLLYSLELLNVVRRAIEAVNHDLVFIQKGILLTNFRGAEKLFQPVGERLIFDLDDAIYGSNLIESSFPLLRITQDSEQTMKLTSHCRAVIAGNHYLQGLALRHNKNVYVVPTPVDSDRFRPLKSGAKCLEKGLVIGWLGQATGLFYFSLVREALRQISCHYDVKIQLVTTWEKVSFDMPGVRIEKGDWAFEREVEQLNQFDIAISPLADDEWAKGKCSTKLLQYMAAGLPTVSSRAGMNREVVEEGVDGFLAETTEEWFEKLSLLIEERSLRESMGERARQKILESYSLRVVSQRLGGILKEVYLKRIQPF